MNTDGKHSLSSTMTAAAIGILIAVAFLVLYWKYVFSSYLFGDDNFFLPQAVLGELELTLESPRRILFAILGWTGSYAVIKISALLSIFLAAGLAVAALRTAGLSIIFATLFVCTIFTFPLAVSQPFFVMGAHPTMGAVFVMAALMVFQTAIDLEGREFLIRMGAVLAFMILAFFSVVYSLALLAPAFWIIMLIVLRRRIFAHSIPAIAMFAIAAVLLNSDKLSGHNYETLQGWTDYSLATILENFSKAINTIIEQIYDRPPYLRFAYFAAGAALVASLLYSTLRTRLFASRVKPAPIAANYSTLIMFAGMCLIVSTLAFGPGSIVGNFLDRYIVGPFIFGALAVAAILGYALKIAPRFIQIVCAGMLSVIIASNFLARHQDLEKRFARLFDSHQHIQRLIYAESGSWPENAQIVLLLDPPLISPTRAYNHWSSWYLKGLTRRRDITGIIGRRRDIEGDPFINQYFDHGPIFWEVKNGMSRRKKMIGLVRERPLFAYKLSDSNTHDAKYLRATVIFSNGDARFATPPGQTPNDSMLIESHCVAAFSSSIVWPGRVQLFPSQDARRIVPAQPARRNEAAAIANAIGELADCSDSALSNP